MGLSIRVNDDVCITYGRVIYVKGDPIVTDIFNIVIYIHNTLVNIL